MTSDDGRGDRADRTSQEPPDTRAEIEDMLRVTTERLEAAVQASELVVFNQDRELRYTWILKGPLGCDANDAIGKRDSDLFERAEDAARTEAIKARVIETGAGERHEVTVVHRGAEHCYNLSVQPQRDRRGQTIGVTCAAVDITAHKQAQANAVFLAELTDALMPVASPLEIARIAAERITGHFRLTRCLLVEVDRAAERATVFYDSGVRSESDLAGVHRISDFHSEDERRRLAAGEPVAVDDVRDAPRAADAAGRFRSLHIGAILDAPYISEGRWRFVLSAIHSAPHVWRADEIALLRELAARIYLRLDRARSDEALRAAHDTFHHLVEQSPFGIYVVDADFRLVQVSAGARRVFENIHPLLGRDFPEVLRLLWPEPFATDVIRIFERTLETGVPYHAPRTVERRHDIGTVESYDWKTERLTLPDGRFGVVCHFYDLSERQRYEAALRDADRQKDEFIAMLAHELRNPLAPIRTAAGLLRMRGALDPVVRKCGDMIDRQTVQMARLLDDLFDVSRLARGQLMLQRETLLLDDVIEAAVETSRPLIDQYGHQLDLASPDTGILLEGDGARLTQVFANLLNNAAKFSPPGSRITVAARREDRRAVISVKDTGVGIPPELIDRVFELFTQGSALRTNGPAGLGIGLSLARRLLELHGGAISVASAGVGRGSEFVVTLPLAGAAEPVQRGDIAASAAPQFAGCRVLIVDDNVDAAQVTALLLEGIGCQTRTTHDGHAALAEAETFRPGIIILDLGLPDLDGYEIARRIRALPWGAGVILLAMSGWGRDEDRESSRKAGFDCHLTKPVDPELLLQTIRVLADGRSG